MFKNLTAALFTASVLACAAAGMSITARAAGNVAINATNFPDEVFRTYVSDNLDTDSNGSLSESEISAARSINVADRGVKDLTGLGYFTSLKDLQCYKNELTSIDISNNLNLWSIRCGYNQLTSLNTSKNTALSYISCTDNQLTSLDLSNNTKLEILYCDINNLTSLDVSKNTVLETLGCNNNSLTKIDISNNTVLRSFDCYKNQIESIDVSKNTDLVTFKCNDNQIKSLDISKNTKLTYFSCNDNEISELAIGNNTALKELDCSDNKITQLRIGQCPALTNLNCKRNGMKILTITQAPALLSLECNSNDIVNLDLSNAPALTYLDCASNSISFLDISHNTELTELWCGYNELTSLDLSKNTKLSKLYSYNNKLTSLDLSKNTALTMVYTDGCSFTLTSTSLAPLNKFGFDPAKVVSWNGAKYNSSTNSLYDFNAYKGVQYDYDIGYGDPVTFTLGFDIVIEAPVMLSLTQENCAINLTWSPVANADEYTIYRATSAEGTKTMLDVVKGTSFTDTTAEFGMTYYYFVRGYSSAASVGSPLCECKSITFTSLAVPTINSIDADSSNVTLSWTAVPGATTYNVYRATSATGDKTLVQSVNTTSYTDTTAIAGNTYYYFVQACNSTVGAASDYSTAKSISITATLAVPTISSVTQAKGKINISWGAVDGATSYKVYRATSATGTKTLLKTVGITSCADSTAVLGNTYYYFVQAYSSTLDVSSDYSDYKSLKFTSIAPPTLNSVTSDGSKVTLSWSAVDGATSYRIYRGTSAAGSKSLLKTVGITSCNDTTVSDGNTYYYFVAAYSSKTGTLSAASNTKSVTFESSLSVPTISSVTQAKGKVTISWKAVDGATSYKVYRATSATGTKTLLKTVGITSCTDTTATLGTTYYYFVQAYSSKTATTSAYSGYKSLKFTSVAPPTLNSVTKSNNVVTLSWSAVPGATSYRVYRGTSATGTKTLLKTVSTTSCNNTSVTAGTTYYYYVAAYSSETGTLSAASNTKSITV